MERRIERTGNLGKREALLATQVERGRLIEGALAWQLLRAGAVIGPVRQAVRIPHVLGQHQQERKQGMNDGAVEGHVWAVARVAR